jgi:putative SOS response-associated peptidase YedK
MCGRYASARKRQELLAEFQVQADHAAESLEPDYNVAPTKPVYGIVARRERSSPDDGAPRPRADGDGRPVTRQLRVLRWGLVPSWAKDPSRGSNLINARVETVAVKPAFRRAFAQRRCLLPADGYYEWQPGAPVGGRVRKQPLFMSPRGGGVLAMAGLYELWRVPDLPADDQAAWLWTATIITTRATDEFGHIHDRMPTVIERGQWAHWLDPVRTDPADLLGLLQPAASADLDTRRVSPAVNNVRNNGPELIEPVPPGDDLSEAPASLF